MKVVACVSSHPRVVSGDITEDEAFLEFLTNFGDKANDGRITLIEWVDYYSAVSAVVADDGHFVNLMKSYWDL